MLQKQTTSIYLWLLITDNYFLPVLHAFGSLARGTASRLFIWDLGRWRFHLKCELHDHHSREGRL